MTANLNFATKELMEQYETVRESGACNMFNYSCVINVADQMELYELASLTMEEYGQILMDFSSLMKKHDIQQPPAKAESA